MDAIAGGGALISIPAYLIAGIPIHTAIATNKLSACFGASMSAGRFIRRRMVNWKLGIPSVIFAMAGSAIGANLSMHMDESFMMKVLFVVLPITAFVVLNRKIFHDHPEAELIADRKTFTIVMTVAFVVGIYDGFFGPGAGTFSIICFTVFGKMRMINANAQAKLINVATTIAALAVFITNAQVMIPLGIIAGICNMTGSYVGAGLAMTKGERIIKPALLIILVLLAIKVAGVY